MHSDLVEYCFQGEDMHELLKGHGEFVKEINRRNGLILRQMKNPKSYLDKFNPLWSAYLAALRAFEINRWEILSDAVYIIRGEIYGYTRQEGLNVGVHVNPPLTGPDPFKDIPCGPPISVKRFTKEDCDAYAQS